MSALAELVYESRLISRYFGGAVASAARLAATAAPAASTSAPAQLPTAPVTAVVLRLANTDYTEAQWPRELRKSTNMVTAGVAHASHVPPTPAVRFLSMFGHQRPDDRINSLLKEALCDS